MPVLAVRKGLKKATELAKKGQAQARKAAAKKKKEKQKRAASNYGKYGATPPKKKKRAKTKDEKIPVAGSGGKEKVEGKVARRAAIKPSNIFKKIKAQVADGRIKSGNDISAADFAILRTSKEFTDQRNAVKGLKKEIVDDIKSGRRKKTPDGEDVSLWGFINRPTGTEKIKTGPEATVGTVGYSAKGKEVGSMKFTKDDLADIKQPVSPRDERKVRKAKGGLHINKGRTGRFGHSDYRGNK